MCTFIHYRSTSIYVITDMYIQVHPFMHYIYACICITEHVYTLQVCMNMYIYLYMHYRYVYMLQMYICIYYEYAYISLYLSQRHPFNHWLNKLI